MHLLDWFEQLHSTRQSNGFGACRIPYSEIDAWIRLTGVRPTAWEIRVLVEIDKLFTRMDIENRPKPDGKR